MTGCSTFPNSRHSIASFPSRTAAPSSTEERAKRRFGQNGRYGYGEDFEKVLKEIIARDEQDKNRKIAPLKVADDAIVIDSTNMSVDDVIKFIEKKIQEKI